MVEADGTSRPEGHTLLPDDIAHIVWIATPDGTTHYLNRYGREFLGLAANEANLQVWLRLVHPDDATRVQAAWLAADRTRAAYELEYRLRRADGEYRWIFERAVPEANPDGRTLKWVGTCTDIEEQKRAIESMRKSELRYRRLFEEATNGILMVHAETGDIVDGNPFLCDLLGCRRDQLLGKKLWELAPADQVPASLALFRELRRAGHVHAQDVALKTSRGQDVHVEFVGNVFGVDGEGAIQCNLRDITERRSVEAELRASNERFRNSFELGLVGLVVTSSAKGFVEVNDEFCRIMGYERQELLQTTWPQLTHPDDLARDVALFDRLLAGESDAYSMEKRFIRKGGEILYSRISVRCVRHSDGSIDYVLGMLEDLTQRKRAEETQARLGRAVEQTTESIVITDPQGAIVYVNPAFERTSGYAREEVLGQNPRIFKSSEADPSVFRDLWAALGRGESWKGRFVNRRKDGTVYEEHATIAPVRDASGSVVNYVAVKRDVTAELQMERQLRAAQKMEAIGRLAGGVAHDFNNLLGVIMGYAEILARRLPPQDPLQGRVEQILKAVQSAANLTRQLLAFTRQQVLQPKILDLNRTVSELERMLHRLIGADIGLKTVLEPNLGSVRADPGQVEQILVNLVANSRDAMPGGGHLTIGTNNVELLAGYAESHPPTEPGRYVVLSVSDTGVGMDQELQARLFEPFFTTKEVGQGVGLGLATVYGIVRQSGGSISVFSRPGAGTTFKIYLPRVDEPVPDRRDEIVAPLGRGTETVLVVEDGPTLRDILIETLEGQGYKVLTAGDGPEALRTAAAHADPIHALVTDLIMPGMTGKHLAEALALSRPGLKVLFISGYSDEAIPGPGAQGPDAAFLGKPFGPDALLRKVRALLDAPRA